jgi:hypothetical protein
MPDEHHPRDATLDLAALVGAAIAAGTVDRDELFELAHRVVDVNERIALRLGVAIAGARLNALQAAPRIAATPSAEAIAAPDVREGSQAREIIASATIYGPILTPVNTRARCWRTLARMGFRFQRRIRLGPGLRINLSKSGVSTSVGGRGAWFTIGPRGTRSTIGLPGTGLSYTEQSTKPTGALPLALFLIVIGLLAIAFLA